MIQERLESGIDFFEFDEGTVFIGRYVDTVLVNDEETNEDKKITAHIFEQIETGEEYYISCHFLVDRAIRKMKESKNYSELYSYLQITFIKKDEIKGKPFNRFEIFHIIFDPKEKLKDNDIIKEAKLKKDK